MRPDHQPSIGEMKVFIADFNARVQQRNALRLQPLHNSALLALDESLLNDKETIRFYVSVLRNIVDHAQKDQ